MDAPPASTPLSRRELLRRGGALAGLLAVGGVLTACGDPRDDIRRLAFLNWQDYIDRKILGDWERRENAAITYETYASNDDLATRLEQASRSRRGGREGSTFDLIVPSDNFITRFRENELIQRLDRTRLTNLDNLDPALRRAFFDVGNRFTVPWATGTTGIGYDKTAFSEPPGYDVFLDDKHAGRTTILNEIRDAFGLALFSLDADPNTRDPDTIDRAAGELIKMKQVIRGFDSDRYLDDLARGRLVAVQGYSVDVAQARERNPRIDFTIPKAGGLRWVDALAIPTDAPHEDRALDFMNYYLRADVSAANAFAIKADTGNAAARNKVPESLLDDPIVFPSDAVLDRCVFTDDLGEDEALYEDAWKRVTDS